MATSDPLYLITGATGNTGVPAVQQLINAGKRVRALVHRSDQRSDRLADLGAEIVEGDLLDFGSVSAAMIGVYAAYFCYPIAPGKLLQATAYFAQAASEAGVHAIVNMSQISARREAKSHAAQDHWLAERLLDRTALITTHLRPTFFAEWLNWWWRREDGEGVLRLPFGTGHHAPIAGRDQGNVIAAILQNPDPHNRQVYPLFGPEDLDHHAIAAKMAAVMGIPVRFEPIDIATFGAALTSRGAPAPLVQHLTNVAQDYQDGVFAGTNNLVEVLSGIKPFTVEEYVAANRAAFDADGHLSFEARFS
jgi:NAD(P)H dehydrogenase (quinone)